MSIALRLVSQNNLSDDPKLISKTFFIPFCPIHTIHTIYTTSYISGKKVKLITIGLTSIDLDNQFFNSDLKNNS